MGTLSMLLVSAYRPCAVTSLCVTACVATVSTYVAILSVNFARARTQGGLSVRCRELSRYLFQATIIA